MSGRVPPNFDRVARIYRWAEYLSLGPFLQQTRTHFLPQLRDCRSAFVLGDGDGRFLARLMQQNPELSACAIDTSDAMLKQLKQNCASASAGADERLQAHQSSALDAIPFADVDVVVTHFFLDCLTQSEVNRLTKTYSQVLAPGTFWVISDFALPRKTWLRPLAALYIRSLYLVFHVLTGLRVKQLPDPQAALTNANFRRTSRHDLLNGLIYTELWVRG